MYIIDHPVATRKIFLAGKTPTESHYYHELSGSMTIGIVSTGLIINVDAQHNTFDADGDVEKTAEWGGSVYVPWCALFPKFTDSLGETVQRDLYATMSRSGGFSELDQEEYIQPKLFGDEVDTGCFYVTYTLPWYHNSLDSLDYALVIETSYGPPRNFNDEVWVSLKYTRPARPGIPKEYTSSFAKEVIPCVLLSHKLHSVYGEKILHVVDLPEPKKTVPVIKRGRKKTKDETEETTTFEMSPSPTMQALQFLMALITHLV